jgi:hypothetical protein
MRIPRVFAVVACVAGLVSMTPAAASSAPVSTTFKVVGYEYAFTSTVGSFAGTGSGDAGGKGYWNARVKHDRLGSSPTYVNGGSFAMTVQGPGTAVDAVVGTFTHHGGTIRTLDRGANCTNQRYLVTDTLEDVRTATTANGTGKFQVTLTHYRHRVLGRCIAYKARVSGSVSFTY